MDINDLMNLALMLLIIDAAWGIYIKFKLMTQHKRLFICDEDGDNCEPA